MNKTSGLLILLASYFALSSAQAAETCVTGNASSTSLIDQLATAKKESDITKYIYSKYQIEKKSEADCPTCAIAKASASDDDNAAKAIQSAVFKSPEPPKLAYKHECLQISNKSSSATASQISCPGGKAVKSNMCVTDEQLSYQNAVISNLYNCAVKSGLTGLDLNAIFQKLSIESGFRPQYASRNGVGMGQVTTIFVEDVHQKHRGRKYLEAMAKNNSDDCKAAQMISKKDLDKKPKLSNSCDFISTGEGFERNVLYGLVGTTTAWEKNLEPKLRKYLKKYQSHPQIEEVKKLTVMNAYGSGGTADASAAAYHFRHLPPDKFVKRMKKNFRIKSGRNITRYTASINSRQNVIGKSLTGQLKSDFATAGADACINPY